MSANSLHLSDEVRGICNGRKGAGENSFGDEIEAGKKEKMKSDIVSALTTSNSFPPRCHWECHMDRYPGLSKNMERTKEAALAHYINRGAKKSQDCSCVEKKKRLERGTEDYSLPLIRDQMSSFHSIWCDDIANDEAPKDYF